MHHPTKLQRDRTSGRRGKTVAKKVSQKLRLHRAKTDAAALDRQAWRRSVAQRCGLNQCQTVKNVRRYRARACCCVMRLFTVEHTNATYIKIYVVRNGGIRNSVTTVPVKGFIRYTVLTKAFRELACRRQSVPRQVGQMALNHGRVV